MGSIDTECTFIDLLKAPCFELRPILSGYGWASNTVWDSNPRNPERFYRVSIGCITTLPTVLNTCRRRQGCHHVANVEFRINPRRSDESTSIHRNWLRQNKTFSLGSRVKLLNGQIHSTKCDFNEYNLNSFLQNVPSPQEQLVR